ncbi:hypothetical protein BG846_02597 [Streptomyces fradiae ATCC 10745 = DSM 40063]|uniref:Uncharacterized protein n=1 Tax=Streptomyces fradiae ATCC 10745 = DSM 40063 TaxID=1319510 RepID=A0A1Y2NW29_STRFR|nr:hypothetical protein BG846_02597 [Streptomyces fradiae ATCC 10745 = DSM 40063]
MTRGDRASRTQATTKTARATASKTPRTPTTTRSSNSVTPSTTLSSASPSVSAGCDAASVPARNVTWSSRKLVSPTATAA